MQILCIYLPYVLRLFASFYVIVGIELQNM